MTPSEAALKDAKADLLKTRAQIARAKARTEKANAKIKELALERDLDKREKELAANTKHKLYVFDNQVSPSSVKSCISQLTEWSRVDPKCQIEIQINSPGGTISDGFALIDFIRGLRADGHTITMVALGWAASMAGVIMQAADRRVMGENAILLIHEGSLGAIGDFGEVEDRVELMRLYHKRILALFEERAKPINPRTTGTFIKNRWRRKDWWIPAEKAKDLGFVDEVR